MNIDLTSLLNLSRIDVVYAIDRAVVVNKEPILKLNDKQLDVGLDANNNSLGRYSNIKYKGRLTPVDLNLKGDFRNTEDIIPNNGEMLFIDMDEKTQYLLRRYGSDVLGLNDEHTGMAADILTPGVIENLKEQLA